MGANNSINRLNAEAFGLFEYLEPTLQEVKERKVIRRKVEETLQKRWPHCRVKAYGSSENGFGFGTSDVDMCMFLDGSDCANFTPQQLLKEAMIQLKSSFELTDFIESARIPIVKLKDPTAEIRCDVSINNPLALRNTALLKTYSLADPRVRPLVYVLKYWAKQRDLNDPANGTLSSYAYVLMALHFLQTRECPIIPCIDVEDDRFAEKFTTSSYGCSGPHSVGALIIELFRYYAYEFDYSRWVISVRSGKCLEKSEKWNRYVPWRLSIEDPFEVNHDVAKVIFSKKGQALIIQEFQRACTLLIGNAGLHVICNSKKSAMTTTALCYLCDGFDHTPRECHYFFRHSSFCEQLKDNAQLPKCWHCGKVGHVRAACPHIQWEGVTYFTRKNSDPLNSSSVPSKFNSFADRLVPKIVCKN